MTYPEYATMAEAAGKPHVTCRKCGTDDALDLILLDSTTPNWAKVVCRGCTDYGGIDPTFVRFATKPDNLGKRPHRPGGSKLLDILRETYGEEPLYCLICLRDAHALTDTWMEAHHVIEYQDGGTDTAENLMPVCQECHTLIHWRRKTVTGDQAGKL